MSVRTKIERAAQLSPSDWSYLFRASLELLAARVRFAKNPSQTILHDLQQRSAAQQAPMRDGAPDVQKLSWAIGAASALVPWRSDCLIQAMAADKWLRRHGLFPEFYLGVVNTPPEGFTGHAWLRFEDIVVTGGQSDELTPLIEPHSR